MSNINLLSTTSRVESPFIIAKMGGYSFGLYNKSTKVIIDSTGSYNGIITDYPNYMTSLSVVKVNGAVNTYTLKLTYTIRPGDDPNLIDKILSKAKTDRKIVLTYGDASIPAFVYKEEEAIITDVKTSMNFSSSTFTYTISAISGALSLASGTYNFPASKAKPSDKIKELLYNSKYGLTQVFTGMIDKDKVLTKGLIASDDRVVNLDSKTNISIFNYIKYLVSCMRSVNDDKDTVFKNSRYTLVIIDDVSGQWQGTYFKVIKIDNKFKGNDSLDAYEIDVGYQGSNIVTNFSIDNDEAYSILYDYSQKINQNEYIHRINDDGELEMTYSPNITNSKNLLKTTESDKTWWTNITQYPINVTLTMKGLIKPTILMSYVKLNVLFFGRRHISSGYYAITKQTDIIDASGFRTTLNLLKLKGE